MLYNIVVTDIRISRTTILNMSIVKLPIRRISHFSFSVYRRFFNLTISYKQKLIFFYLTIMQFFIHISSAIITIESIFPINLKRY